MKTNSFQSPSISWGQGDEDRGWQGRPEWWPIGSRQVVSAVKEGGGGPWGVTLASPHSPSSSLSPRLEIDLCCSGQDIMGAHRQEWEARRQSERWRGRPPLRKCPEEGGWGWGWGHFNVRSQRTEIIF